MLDGGLTKTGTGVLVLNGTVANTYTGGTTVSDGILSLGTGGTGGNTSHQDAPGNGTVTIDGGAELRLWIRNNAAFVIDNDIVLNGGAVHDEDGDYDLTGTVTVNSPSTLSARYSGKDLTVSGVISGVGTVIVQNLHGDNGGAVIFGGSDSNTYTGTTQVNLGNLHLSKTGNAVAVPGNVTFGNGSSGQPYIRTTQNNQFGPTSVMTFANPWGQWTRFDLQGTSQTLAGIHSAGKAA